MSRHQSSFSAKILTASDLLDGDVIYLNAAQTWTRQLSDAHLFVDAEAANAALATADLQQQTVLGAYLVDAATGTNGAPTPIHFREIFRATGPSNRFHGKQADLPA